MAEQPFRPWQRLHQASEFSLVFQFRRVIRGRFFDLHWRPAELPDHLPRLGLVVPKRLARRAVMRNLMKRIAREAFRRRSGALIAMDLVLKLARKPGLEGERGSTELRPSNSVLRQAMAEDVNGLLTILISRQGKKKPG